MFGTLVSWFTNPANSAAAMGAIYGLALLGTHLPDNTLVYKACRWIINGAGIKPPTA